MMAAPGTMIAAPGTMMAAPGQLQLQAFQDDGLDGVSMVQGGHSIIVIKHFTKFTVKARTRRPEGSKRMKCCTFGKSYDRSNSYAFNFRAWNPHDQPAVLLEQKHLKEHPMDAIKAISIQNNGKHVKVYLTNIKKGWESEYDKTKEISHEDLWYDPDEEGSTPHSCRFRLKTEDPKQQSVHCLVKSKQDGSEKETELEVSPPDVQGPYTGMTPTAEQGGNPNLIEAYKRTFGSLNDLELPEDICHELCRELDVKEANCRDWRGLAMQMKLDKMIENLDQNSAKQSPTAFLLLILKKKSKRGEFCTILCGHLKAAGIMSAHERIEKHLKTNPQA